MHKRTSFMHFWYDSPTELFQAKTLEDMNKFAAPISQNNTTKTKFVRISNNNNSMPKDWYNRIWEGAHDILWKSCTQWVLNYCKALCTDHCTKLQKLRPHQINFMGDRFSAEKKWSEWAKFFSKKLSISPKNGASKDFFPKTDFPAKNGASKGAIFFQRKNVTLTW